jgi:hypothetical protein
MSMLAPAVKTRSRSRDFARPAIVVVTMGALLGLGFMTTQQVITASRHTVARASMSGDDDVYTGSILYMPDRGNACRQILFDNRNGQSTDKGYVDCQLAFSHSIDNEPKQWSAARVRVISDGFRGN